MQDIKLQDMKLLHILIVLLRYISDRLCDSLFSTKNCFDELFFLHLFVMSFIQVIYVELP